MNRGRKLIISTLVVILGLFALLSGNFLLPTHIAMTSVRSMLAPSQSSSSTVIFFDNFQEDQVGESSNIGVAGVDPHAPWPPVGYSSSSAFVADGRLMNDPTYPWSPPEVIYPNGVDAWYLAGGGPGAGGCSTCNSDTSGYGWPACNEPGDGYAGNHCVAWDDQGAGAVNGANSIMAISTDQHTADTSKSLLVGDSDNYDKTDVAIRGNVALPSSGYLTASFAIWLSPGNYQGTQQLTMFVFGGTQMRIALSSGDWEYNNPSWSSMGTQYITPATWHVITITANIASGTWNSITLDGVSLFPNMQGVPLQGGVGTHLAWWMNQEFRLGESIYSNGAQWQENAGYFYLDDVSLTTSEAPPTTTVSGSSSYSSSSTVPTTSCCTSSTGSITSGQVFWSADFETGDNSQFNAPNCMPGECGVFAATNTCQNGVIGVSSLNPLTNGGIVHSGNYAGYYSGGPPQDSTARNCREYPVVTFNQFLTDFYWDMWVYVPTFTQTGWVSFATFGNWANPNTQSFEPFTLDALANGDFQLDNIYNGQYFPTSTPVPLNQWFELSLIAHGVGSSTATLQFYLNGQPLVSESGNVQPGPYNSGHFGLYKEASQGNYAVYNDDTVIEALSSSGGTTTTSSQSSTNTSSQTTSTVTSTVTSTGSPTTTISTITTGGSTSLTTATSTASGGTTTLTTTQTGSPTTVTSTVVSTVTTTGSSSNQTSTETSTETTLTTTTLISTLASNQTFATTTTFTATAISSQVSYSFTTLTVSGQSTSSVATTSTMILLTTASLLITTTQTAVTTTNLLGASVNSAGQATNGISPNDVLGLLVTFLLLALMLVRRIFG